MQGDVLIIDKPAGLSSAQVVGRVKKLLHAAKVGHAGTLDPFATGVLVCLVNQATRLALSGCFTESEMTCVDCHNPHRKERGDRVLFSTRCLKCHQTSECGMESKLGERLSENCIDCHMPSRASDKLHLDTADERVFPALRDHNVRVDLKATEDYLKSLAK